MATLSSTHRLNSLFADYMIVCVCVLPVFYSNGLCCVPAVTVICHHQPLLSVPIYFDHISSQPTDAPYLFININITQRNKIMTKGEYGKKQQTMISPCILSTPDAMHHTAWLHGNTEYMPMNVNNAHSIHFQRFQIHNEIYRNGFLSLPISHILIEQRQPLNRNKQ